MKLYYISPSPQKKCKLREDEQNFASGVFISFWLTFLDHNPLKSLCEIKKKREDKDSEYYTLSNFTRVTW